MLTKGTVMLKMNLYFTINQAAYLYFPEMVPDLNLKFDVILNKPRKSTLTNVQLLTAEDTDVVKHKPRPMMLPSAMRSVKQNHTMFNSKGDKALAIDDVSKWITLGKQSYEFYLLWIHSFYYKFNHYSNSLDFLLQIENKVFQYTKGQNYYKGIKVPKISDQYFWKI